MDSAGYWILAAVLVLAVAGLATLMWRKDSHRADDVAQDTSRWRRRRTRSRL